ncbi:MAG: ABC transporter ATP-binding protein, partial [Anaerolineae bacterium]
MSLFHGLDREAYDREYSDRELLRRIARYFAPHKGRVVVVAAVIVVIAFNGAEQLFIISRGIDALLRDAESTTLGPVVGLGAAVVLTGVLNWAGNWLRRRMTARMIGDVVTALRRDAFDAVVKHDMSFFDEFRSGRIISRITSDSEEFANVVQLVTDLLSQLTLVAILLVRLFQMSWRLSMMVLGMSPVVLLLAMGFRRIARRVTRAGFQVLAEVNAAIREAVTGIGVAKIFRQEESIYREFRDVNEHSFRVNLRRGFTLSMVFPVLNALSGIGTAILVYWGGLSAVNGEVSIGNWYLFLRSVDRFWFPLINVAAFWSQFQGGLSASERIFALIDAEPSVQQTANRPLGRLEGEICFQDVYFRYTENERVLKDFNLHIAPGESVAL